MTKKDQVKKIILDALNTSSVDSRHILYQSAIFRHCIDHTEASPATMRRALHELEGQGKIKSDTSGDKIQWELITNSKKQTEDRYQEAARKINAALANFHSAKVIEHRDTTDVTWTVVSLYQLESMIRRWNDMKKKNYKLVTKISVTETSEPSCPDYMGEPENDLPAKPKQKPNTRNNDVKSDINKRDDKKSEKHTGVSDKKKRPCKKRYTRAQALADAIKMGGAHDVNDLIETSNSFYVQHGGKDNLKESKWFANYGLGLLESLGVLTWTEDGKALFRHLNKL